MFHSKIELCHIQERKISAYCLLLVVVPLALLLLRYQNLLRKFENEGKPRKNLAEKYSVCLNEALEAPTDETVAWQLGSVMDLCGVENIRNALSIVTYRNLDEGKLSVEGGDWFNDQSNCTVVTLGVGGDINAELSLRVKHPNCKFYGADPTDYGALFRIIGQFFPIAVDGKTGITKEMHIRLANGTYVEKLTRTVGVRDFFRKFVNENVVDHIWIDIEGAEYEILPILANMSTSEVFSEQKMQKAGEKQQHLDICQMNVEMHGATRGNGAKFGKTVKQFLRDSPLILLNLFPKPVSQRVRHLRLFFFNPNCYL